MKRTAATKDEGDADAKRGKVQLTKNTGNSNGKTPVLLKQGDKAAQNLKALRDSRPACLAEFRHEAPPDDELILVNASGRLVRCYASTVLSYPEGKLAVLLDAQPPLPPGAPAGASRQIFVDISQDRIPYIMDWYRYGEIHVPSSVSVAAILQDACYLGLPDGIIVNGVTRSFNSGAATKVRRDLCASVISRWRDFPDYYHRIVKSVQAHYEEIGVTSNKPIEDEELYDFPPFVLGLTDENGWKDGKNVCNGSRARALALKLEEECGYVCDFTDTELVITVPSRLQGEAPAAQEGPDDEEDHLEEMDDDEHA